VHAGRDDQADAVTLRLRPPRVEDEAAVMAAQAELANDHFEFVFLAPGQPWADYVQQVDDQRRGRHLRDGWVEGTLLLAFAGEELVGRSSIRFALNDRLRELNGHIGYGVRPAHRRRGYATEILRQSLVVVRSVGVDRVRLTCDVGNVGSAAVIESCGGVLEDVATVEGETVRRYWID
jgi:predicted acetyltransferase